MPHSPLRNVVVIVVLSVLVFMGAAWAHDELRRLDDDLYGARADTYRRDADRTDVRDSYRDDRDYDRRDYPDGGDFSGIDSGIDGARAAHYRHGRQRAERLDGNCEEFVAIARGETLSDIAEYCDVPVAAILDANPGIGHPRYIPAGELIRLPNVYGEIYEGGRRLSYKGRAYNDYYLPAGVLEADNRGRTYYTVRRGDTLAEISDYYGVPLSTIAALNPHARPRSLEYGDRIYLPDYVQYAPGERRGDYGRDGRPDRFDPVVSISPRRGPRDGEILIVGEGFEHGGEVAIYLGRGQGEMTRISVVEADGDGRVREKLRLPDDYRFDEAYWGVGRGDGDYILSEAYEVGRYDDQWDGKRDERWDGPRDRRDGDYGGRPRLSVVHKSADRPGRVALVAAGFPPETTVSIFAGKSRNDLDFVARERTDLRGEARIDTRIPGARRADRLVFVARSNDRIAGSHEATAVETVLDYGEPYDAAERYDDNDPLLAAALEERGSTGFFGRFSRRAREALASRDFVEGPHVVARSGRSEFSDGGREVALVGVLTEDRGRCAWLEDDGGNLHALDGRLSGFGPGDRVLVRGRYEGRGYEGRRYEGRGGCGGDAIRVASADWAPR